MDFVVGHCVSSCGCWLSPRPAFLSPDYALSPLAATSAAELDFGSL
jgi:hypothetical protein